jgi:hypothetical protein
MFLYLPKKGFEKQARSQFKLAPKLNAKNEILREAMTFWAILITKSS